MCRLFNGPENASMEFLIPPLTTLLFEKRIKFCNMHGLFIHHDFTAMKCGHCEDEDELRCLKHLFVKTVEPFLDTLEVNS